MHRWFCRRRPELFRTRVIRNALRVCAAAWLCFAAAHAAPLTLVSTTSADNSGLYDYLLPQFTADTSIPVRVVAVGTGRAISIARRGDADLLIVHDRESELEFVASGYGIKRRTFMYNDYVLVGPRRDPAGLHHADDIGNAMRLIYENRSLFVSRGDDSGTHKRELQLWGEVQLTPGGDWYREAGAGMGTVLNIANELPAYTLSDRSTWISFNNRGKLVLLIENEPPLYNPYSVILVNPERHPEVNHHAARRFSDWLVSERGLGLIAAFRVRGVQLFHPLRDASIH